MANTDQVNLEHKHLSVKETAKESAKRAHGLMKEFQEFLQEYKVLGIAAGLVLGAAVTSLTQSIVFGLITPLIQMLLPFDSWKSMVFSFNGANFQIGLVISALINFVIVALLFFLFVRFLLRKEKVIEKKIA